MKFSDDDFGVKFVTASRRLGITGSVFVVGGFLFYFWLRGQLLFVFPGWMIGIMALWVVYATWESIGYWKYGYTNYTQSGK